MKEVIKQLEEEKHRLELREMILIRIIRELEEMGTDTADKKEEIRQTQEKEHLSHLRKAAEKTLIPKKGGRPRKEYKTPGYPKPITAINKAAKKDGRGRRPVYGPEVEKFVREATKTRNQSEISEELRSRFGIETNSTNLSKWMWSRGIKAVVKGHRMAKTASGRREPSKKGIPQVKSKKGVKYTPEVIESIKKMHESMKVKDIAKELKRKHGIKVTNGSLAVFMSNKGITHVRKAKWQHKSPAQDKGEKDFIDRINKKEKESSETNREIRQFILNRKIEDPRAISMRLHMEFGVKISPEQITEILKNSTRTKAEITGEEETNFEEESEEEE